MKLKYTISALCLLALFTHTTMPASTGQAPQPNNPFAISQDQLDDFDTSQARNILNTMPTESINSLLKNMYYGTIHIDIWPQYESLLDNSNLSQQQRNIILHHIIRHTLMINFLSYTAPIEIPRDFHPAYLKKLSNYLQEILETLTLLPYEQICELLKQPFFQKIGYFSVKPYIHLLQNKNLTPSQRYTILQNLAGSYRAMNELTHSYDMQDQQLPFFNLDKKSYEILLPAISQAPKKNRMRQHNLDFIEKRLSQANE
ncbi:hypothetical protein KBD08_02055 [Candidatus Babeliales bacterium]|nr:hypothetical protein [Candidatus Babeliales bacterium]